MFAEIILTFLGFMKTVLLLCASYSILIKYCTPASFMGVPNNHFYDGPIFPLGVYLCHRATILDRVKSPLSRQFHCFLKCFILAVNGV